MCHNEPYKKYINIYIRIQNQCRVTEYDHNGLRSPINSQWKRTRMLLTKNSELGRWNTRRRIKTERNRDEEQKTRSNTRV